MCELRKILEYIKSTQKMIIEKEIVKLLALSQKQLKHKNLKNNYNVLPFFVSPYSPENQYVFPI